MAHTGVISHAVRVIESMSDGDLQALIANGTAIQAKNALVIEGEARAIE